MRNDGGYDEGYSACPCFWGDKPGSLICEVEKALPFEGLRVLDLGCGEGKNSFYLASQGSKVTAIDCSSAAIKNAQSNFSHVNIDYYAADVRTFPLEESKFDITIAYGLLHCMKNQTEVDLVIKKMKSATKPGGYIVVCNFNDRDQDLRAHPGFYPFLAPHSYYVDAFSDSVIILSTDTDLYETHPHNNIPHHHSMTRIICRRPQ